MNIEEAKVFRWMTRSLSIICLLFAGFELLALPPDLISVTHYLKGLNLPGQTPEYHQQLIHFVRSYASYAAVHLNGTASSLGWQSGRTAQAPAPSDFSPSKN